MPVSRLTRMRYAAEWLVVSSLFAMLRRFSLTRSSNMMGRLVRVLGPCTPNHRIARRNLRIAFPEWGAEQQNAVLRGMWENLGRYGGELPHIAGLSREEFRAIAEIRGEEHVRKAQASGKGVLYFSAHMGNWELGAKALWTVESPVAIVYRPLNNARVEALTQAYRNQYQLLGLPKSASGNREMLRLLKAGKPAAILIDQKMNTGTLIPFFGRDAMTSTAIADMAVRYGYPLIPTRVERIGNTTRFRITFEPPVEWEATGDRRADSTRLMRQLHSILEGWIRERPEQWFWLHRRWEIKHRT